VQINIHARESFVLLLLLCLQFVCLFSLNQRGIQIKSRGIKEEIKWKSMWNFKVEIKKNRNTKGNSRNQSGFSNRNQRGIKWIQQIKEEIKVEIKNLQIN
jgi:hypothetical protein